MALSLRDVRCDPIANRALNELMHYYTVAQEKSRLVLTKKTGDMKLFLNDLDDLHQWDFVRNQQMVKEIERLHVLLTTTNQQRESWKVRALMAETQLLEATAKTSNNGGRQNVSDVRYASLKRYLAKRFHPDFAPGEGIEKVVRNEIFKEVWNEIDRLDQGVHSAIILGGLIGCENCSNQGRGPGIKKESPRRAGRRRMIMRKTSLILFGAAAGVAVTLIATQPRIMLEEARAQAADADTYRQLSLFGDIFERLRADYVEKPDESKLIESAINGMLAGLDPHSSYMDSKSFRDLQVQTRGEFGGLGIEVTMEDGLIKVVAPIDETPAAKAGIMANDIIMRLDDEAVQGLTLNQAVDKMRGPVNTKIKLTIIRKGSDKPIEVTIVRDIIRVKSVRSHPEGSDVGYIRVTQFNERTTDALKQAINDLNTQLGADKIKGYILDLRNNPGGLLDQAIWVSETFLEKGE